MLRSKLDDFRAYYAPRQADGPNISDAMDTRNDVARTRVQHEPGARGGDVQTTASATSSVEKSNPHLEALERVASTEPPSRKVRPRGPGPYNGFRPYLCSK